ncbi:hypothetical protein Godav_002488, partial [Gossypium davidsonii]|nr:hypothetical protein [Gossypium davidsonii]MBA0672588.1 hypothetical protein [Gossypium klotzschianum]
VLYLHQLLQQWSLLVSQLCRSPDPLVVLDLVMAASLSASSSAPPSFYFDDKWKFSKKESSSKSRSSSSSYSSSPSSFMMKNPSSCSSKRSAFTRKCARLVKEQRAHVLFISLFFGGLVAWESSVFGPLMASKQEEEEKEDEEEFQVV